MVNTAKEDASSRSLGLEEVEEIDISSRDSSVLQAIQEEGFTVFTFDGLKRMLGVHQEKLSRVLTRLEEEGLLERVAGGYSITHRGNELIPRPMNSVQPRVPIVQSLLPQDVDLGLIISSLKGRWFGSLRWLGYTQNDEGTVLKWITEDDSIQIHAKFSGSFLNIEAKVGDEKEVGQAVKAAHQLLGYVSRLYNGPRKGRSMAAAVSFYTDASFA
jgi:DNA-binding Lrp family transcriptional regulator